MCRCLTHFNPRTHVGCDELLDAVTVTVTDFNPRTHVGCDRASPLPPPGNGYFNPRTHVGCDLKILTDYERFIKISIHAPTWGATRSKASRTSRLNDFNPRTHVGCDFESDLGPCEPSHFNPRTHVGCDAKTYYEH